MKRHDLYYVYMIQDKNGAYYSGYTKDLNGRLGLHSKGQGAKYLRGRAPLRLVYYKEYSYYKNALLAEQRLKRLTRKRKEELVFVFESELNVSCLVKAAPAAPRLLSQECAELVAGAPEVRS